MNETLRLMAEIDAVVDQHGGRPGAFGVAAGGKKWQDLCTRRHHEHGIARGASLHTLGPPEQPEAIADPKRKVVDLARRSRKKAIQKDMVPRTGSGCAVGPAYASRLVEFVEDGKNGWRPEAAAAGSDSLQRCLRCLKRLVEEMSPP